MYQVVGSGGMYMATLGVVFKLPPAVALGAINYPLNLTRRQRRNANRPQQWYLRRKQASPGEISTLPKQSRSRKGARAETVTPLTSSSPTRVDSR